jgi:hypothetical protein
MSPQKYRCGAQREASDRPEARSHHRLQDGTKFRLGAQHPYWKSEADDLLCLISAEMSLEN